MVWFPGLGDDDNTSEIALSESFNFYGVDYNFLTMATNGYITTDPMDGGTSLGNGGSLCPMPDELLHTDPMFGKRVQCSVVGFWIDSPEPSPTDVGKSRTELIVEQPEQTEDNIAGPGRIGHDLDWLETGLLFQKPLEDVDGIAQGAGDNNIVEPGVFLGGEIVIGDSALGTEVFPIGTGVDRPHRRDEAHAIGGCDLSAAPLLS